MGEWRRILANPRRLALLIALPLISVLMYVVGRMDNIQLESWGKMVEDSSFQRQIVEQYKGMDTQEALADLTQRNTMLGDVSMWTRGWALEGASKEDIIAMLTEYPSVAELIDDTTAFRTEIRKYTKVYDLLIQQMEYLQEYPVYLEKIQQQALQQSQTTVFGNHDSFSYRNLQETAKQFARMQGVDVVFGNNQAVESWIAFELADYLYVIGLIVIVLAFLEERKKGLWSTIRSCRYGRLKLGAIRVGIMLGMAVIYTVLVYGTNLAIAFALDGGWDDLARPLQSLMSFKTCPIQVSIGEWIGQYLLVKAASGFFIGLLLWCVLGFISNIQFSLTVLGGVLAGEYILFATLPVQSIFNPLKYFNIFSYIRTSALYTQYLNIDLLGYPVGIRALALLALPFLIALSVAGVLLIARNRYPEGNRDWLGKIAGIWSRIMDVPRRWLSIGGMEGYKTLFLEWSIVLLIALWAVSGNLTYFSYRASENGSHWYQAYLEDAQGKIDENMDGYLVMARELAGDGSDSHSAELLGAIDELEMRVVQLRQRAEEGGYEPWLMVQSDYQNVYGTEAEYIQRQNGALALILVLLCCAGLVAYERQAGVVPLLRSLKRGRRSLFLRKVIMAVLMAVAVWTIVYGTEIQVILEQYQYQTLDAPVQNLDFLRNFPIVMSVKSYMILTYALRFVMLLATAGAAIWISGRAKTMEAAYMINLGVLGVPALLFVLGIEICGWVSPVIPVAVSELLLGLCKGWASVIPWILWLVIGAAALWRSRREWIK